MSPWAKGQHCPGFIDISWLLWGLSALGIISFCQAAGDQGAHPTLQKGLSFPKGTSHGITVKIPLDTEQLMTDEALIFLAFLSLSWSLNSNSCCSVWEGISLWEGETLNHHVHHKLLVPTATTSSKLFGEVLIGIGVLNWWLSQDYSKWCTEICFPQMWSLSEGCGGPEQTLEMREVEILRDFAPSPLERLFLSTHKWTGLSFLGPCYAFRASRGLFVMPFRAGSVQFSLLCFH